MSSHTICRNEAVHIQGYSVKLAVKLVSVLPFSPPCSAPRSAASHFILLSREHMTSHYHIERKRAACDVYRFAQNLRSQTSSKSIKPIDFACAAAGGASERSVYGWLAEDLSLASVSEEQEHRGAHKLLSEDQESLLIGFALSQRSSLEPVTRQTLHQFCASHFNVTPSQPTLSRTMTEFGFSSQKAMSRSSRMVGTEVVDAALSSIEEIRSYDFPPDQVLFMDETGLWSNVKERQTYNYQNWYANLKFLTSSAFPVISTPPPETSSPFLLFVYPTFFDLNDLLSLYCGSY